MKYTPSHSDFATQPSGLRMRKRWLTAVVQDKNYKSTLTLTHIRDENKWRKRQEYWERRFLFWRSISPPSQRVFPSPRLRWGKTREVYCEAPPLMRRWEVSLSPPPGNRWTDPSRRRWNIQQQHIFSNLNSLWPVKFWLNLTLRHFIFI